MKVAQSLKFSRMSYPVIPQSVIGGAQPVTKIAAGGYHRLFLKSDGSMWAVGFNGVGQLPQPN